MARTFDELQAAVARAKEARAATTDHAEVGRQYRDTAALWREVGGAAFAAELDGEIPAALSWLLLDAAAIVAVDYEDRAAAFEKLVK